MSDNFLEKLFEHNNWANDQIIRACAGLSDEQLDAKSQSATMGSIRETLLHLAKAQRGYIKLLTLPVEARRIREPLEFADVQKSVSQSGERLLALARDASKRPKAQLQTADDFLVEPWVMMMQAINHATEHREQIKSMLSALGVTPPEVDGWSYAEVMKAMVPIAK